MLALGRAQLNRSPVLTQSVWMAWMVGLEPADHVTDAISRVEEQEKKNNDKALGPAFD